MADTAASTPDAGDVILAAVAGETGATPTVTGSATADAAVASTPVENPAPEEPKSSESTEDEPLGEPGKKALQAEREARKAAEKLAKELQAQLDAKATEGMSDLEKAQKAAADAAAKVEEASRRAMRAEIALEYGISREDMELFLTAGDEDTLRTVAKALRERTKSPGVPKPDLSQGSSGKPAASTADQFAAVLDKLL